MHISVKWFAGKYPSFNLNLHSAEGKPEFLSIKGCRVVSSSKGEFVSYPSQKKDDGTYWNHVWGGEAFNAKVLELALADMPEAGSKPAAKKAAAEDLPF